MTDRPAPRWLSPVMLPVLLAVLFGTYANALHNPFIIDDIDAIEQNEYVIEPSGIRTLWVDDYWAVEPKYANLYRPVVIFSYHLNARLPGVSSADEQGNRYDMRPIGFRVFNVALLAVVAWLTGLWLRRYAGPAPAWCAAVLLAAHPSFGYLISPVIGRADLLAMLGVVGFGYLQKRAIDAGHWTPIGVLGAALFVAAGIGSKESGLAVVPVALVQGWLASREDGVPWKVHIWAAVAVGLAIAAYAVGRIHVLELVASEPRPDHGDLTGNPARGVPLIDRLPIVLDIAWWYTRQVVWPNLGYFHIPRDVPTWRDVTPWLGLGVIAAFAVALLALLRRRHWASIGPAAALGQFLIIGNLLVTIGVYAANRLMLPFVFAGAVLVAAVMQRFAASGQRRAAAVALCAAVALASALVTAVNVNPRWSTQITLAERDVKRDPENVVLQYNYAVALIVAAKREPDRSEFLRKANFAARVIEAALRLRPDSIQARYQLTSIYQSLRYDRKALRHLNELLRRLPDHGKSLRDVGVIHLREHRYDDAELYLSRAVALEPDNAKGLLHWARTAVAQGRWDDAIARYERLLSEHPDHESAREELLAIKLRYASPPATSPDSQ